MGGLEVGNQQVADVIWYIRKYATIVMMDTSPLWIGWFRLSHTQGRRVLVGHV